MKTRINLRKDTVILNFPRVILYHNMNYEYILIYYITCLVYD